MIQKSKNTKKTNISVKYGILSLVIRIPLKTIFENIVRIRIWWRGFVTLFQTANICVICRKKLFAVSHHPDCGPVFGAGADLFLCDECDRQPDSYSNLPHSYDGPVRITSMHSFFHPFFCSFVHLSIHSLLVSSFFFSRSYIRSFIHIYIRSVGRSLIN
jgi:hypothetical protein